MERILFSMFGGVLVFACVQSCASRRRSIVISCIAWIMAMGGLYIQAGDFGVELVLKISAVTIACQAAIWFGRWAFRSG